MTTLRQVNLGDLVLEHEFWTNPRSITGLGEAELEELAGDIKHRGIQDPPKVQKIKNGGSGHVELVVDGQRRLLAAARAGFKKSTPIEVIDHSPDVIELNEVLASKLLMDVLAAGNHRSGLSSFEQSENAERLRKSGAKLSDIARSLRRSETWVSRFLKARSSATPALLKEWSTGKITDEMFKDLAEVKADKQTDVLAEVKETRKTGDQDAKGNARAKVKEIAESAKHAKKVQKADAKAEKMTKKGEQLTGGLATFSKNVEKATETKPEPKKITVPSRAVFDDFAHMAKRKPATHDYVKGIMDCARFAIGEIGSESFAKPWATYIARLEGRPTKVAKAPKVKKLKKVKAAKVKATRAPKAPKAKPKKATKKKR